jgi:hypothetical protein
MTAKSKPSATQQSLLSEKNRCKFSTADGRQCRMYRSKNHKTFCLVHAQHEEQILNAETVAAELIGPITKFQTALEVNRTLGNLFTLVAQKRISRQDGALLGFISQMLLNSIGSTVKSELQQAEGSKTPPYWETNVRRALARLVDARAITPGAPPPDRPSHPHADQAIAASGSAPQSIVLFPAELSPELRTALNIESGISK